MSRLRLLELRRGDYVWIARTWPWPVVYHDRSDRDDREWAQRGHNGVITGWAFTRCGLRIADAIWDTGEGWSERTGRFAVGPSRGHDLPLRLLNPDQTLPCRRCFDVTGATP